MQRVRVGMVGLALVVLLIGLASAVFSVANRDTGSRIAGTNPDSVANMTLPANGTAEVPSDEPLVELGVSPGTAPTAAPTDAAAPPAEGQGSTQPQPEPAPQQ